MDSSRNDSEKVARFVAQTNIEKIPNDVLAAAKTAILDCLGVALAGSHEESARCGIRLRTVQRHCKTYRRVENDTGIL
jgi:2-methylcitrate dehydratase PrpD